MGSKIKKEYILDENGEKHGQTLQTNILKKTAYRKN